MAVSGVAWRSVSVGRQVHKLLEVLGKIDGEIKAAPAAGPHVVVWEAEFQPALFWSGWHNFHFLMLFQAIGGWLANFLPWSLSHE